MEISEILKSFENCDSKYKREEVDAAVAQREEITPHLISILGKVLQNHADIADEYDGHIYAFMLLGHFNETKAHDVIVNIFSLPGDFTDSLFGDLVTESLPIVLFQTCGGKIDRIKELIVNMDAEEYCRGSALRALLYATLEGYTTRAETISFFKELFAEEYSDESSYFHTLLASSVYDLYPDELMDTIEQAFANGQIDPSHIAPSDFNRALKFGKEVSLSKLAQEIKNNRMDNIHDSMLWLHPDEEKKISIPSFNPNEGKSKVKKKSKRKQAKTSRKANRKKK